MNQSDAAELFEQLISNDPLKASDVGADGGICEHWMPFLNSMQVDAFEPNEKECAYRAGMSPPRITWFPIGLAKTSGEHTLYVPNRTSGASLYPPNPYFMERFGCSAYWGEVKQFKIKCSSYQDFLSERKKTAPNLIKLDVQGAELDILSSFTDDQLNEVICVETEVEFYEIYQGQPLFCDVHAFMVSKGFELMDLRTARVHNSKGDVEDFYLKNELNTSRATPHISAQLVGGDALYFRNTRGNDLFRSKNFLIKSVICACIYHYYDLALWLIDQPQALKLFSNEEMSQLKTAIKKSAPKPRLRDRNDFIGRLIRKLRKKLRISDDMSIYWMKREWPNL